MTNNLTSFSKLTTVATTAGANFKDHHVDETSLLLGSGTLEESN